MSEQSGAMELLSVLWNHRQEATGHSWLRMNQSMQGGLRLAVEMGLSFDKEDLKRMVKDFRAGYWFGDLEDFYRRSVMYGNAAAYQCFEAYVNRKPFIIPEATCDVHYGGGRAGGNLARLVVGAKFAWLGERVTVTSFSNGEQESYFTACSYERTERTPCPRCPHCYSCGGGSGTEKILHRHQITHADIKATRKKDRDDAKALAETKKAAQ